MNEQEKKEFQDLMNATLDERNSIDALTHKSDHDLVQVIREERKRIRDRNEAIKRQVMGWAVIGTMITMISGLGALVLNWIAHNNGGPPGHP